jgi:hypothetical protein
MTVSPRSRVATPVPGIASVIGWPIRRERDRAAASIVALGVAAATRNDAPRLQSVVIGSPTGRRR